MLYLVYRCCSGQPRDAAFGSPAWCVSFSFFPNRLASQQSKGQKLFAKLRLAAKGGNEYLIKRMLQTSAEHFMQTSSVCVASSNQQLTGCAAFREEGFDTSRGAPLRLSKEHVPNGLLGVSPKRFFHRPIHQRSGPPFPAVTPCPPLFAAPRSSACPSRCRTPGNASEATRSPLDKQTNKN